MTPTFKWDTGNALLRIEQDGATFAIPLAMLPTLAMQARRVMAAHQAKQDRSNTQHGWMPVHPLPVQQVEVATMTTHTGPRCLLTLDPGTEIELRLLFPSNDIARQTGEALAKAATDAAAIQPPSRN